MMMVVSICGSGSEEEVEDGWYVLYVTSIYVPVGFISIVHVTH